ncbi:MAG: hypothetical protein MUO23_04565 [Anaerolineales bacterium]|nr:hypothetical protein [Anaerolineales bacterium]
MKRNSRILLAGVVVLTAAALTLVLGFSLLRKGQPAPAPSQIALPPLNPIRVTISSPAEGGTFPLNGSVPVLVDLASELPLQGIRFWLDGLEIGAVVPDAPAISAEFGFPSTLLKGEGWHTLYAGAVDQVGRVALSNAVHIKSSPAVGMETIYVTEAGDTLDSIAAAFQADPDKMQSRNSGWSGGGADPHPVGAAVIIPFDPPSPPPQAEPPPPEVQPPFSSSLPKPPSIELRAEQCAVTVTLQDLATDADGFVLYRLDAQDNQFAAISSFEAGQGGPLDYQDTTASGTVQYVASAYTDQGESLGNPAEIALTAPGCANPSTLIVSGNLLSLPPSPNGTYFYWATEGAGYERYPASSVEFLTLEDGTFDLRSLPSPPEAGGTQTGVALEAWRWDAGQLSLLGSAQARVQTDTELLICPSGTICGGGDRPYSQSAVVGSDQKDQLRKFKWQVVSPLASSYTAVLFQLSVQPFPAGVEENPPGLAYSKVLSGTVGSEDYVSGAFNLNFKTFGEYFTLEGSSAVDPSQLVVQDSESPVLINPWMVSQYEKDNPENSGLAFLLNQDASLNDNLASIPLTYYARVVPLSGGKLVPSPSNTVTIEYRPSETDQIPVLGYAASIYAIDILSSAAPIPPTAHWGCVDILAVNPASYDWYWGNFKDKLHDFEVLRDSHQPYCPQPWQKEEKAWYEELWDWVNEGLDAINAIYQAAKQLSIDYMLLQYDALDNVIGIWDLCGCRDEVYAGLMKGQEWVLKYQFGAPADIPDLNELTEDGIDALAEQALKYAGLDGDNCPKEVPQLDCKKFLADSIRTFRDELFRQSVAASQNDAIAHAQGYYALLLPSDPTALTVRPAKTLYWQMAEAVVRVTRIPGASSLPEALLEKLPFTLSAEVYAVNETCRKREHSFCVDQVTFNGGPAQCNQQTVILPDEPCQGILFGGTRDLPLLAPGESADFTVRQLPRQYWSPSTPEAYKAYNPLGDFDLLYLDAEAELTARVLPNAYMAEASDGPDPFILPVLNPSGLLGGY